MKTLTHQQQPTKNSCVSTCLAMLLDVPAQQVVDEFHDKYYVTQEQLPHEYLAAKGISTKPGISTELSLYPGKLYLVAAASLNLEGQMHEIIVDFRDEEKPLLVLDPNMGKEGKKYYVYKPEAKLQENEVNLTCWFIDYEIENLDSYHFTKTIAIASDIPISRLLGGDVL